MKGTEELIINNDVIKLSTDNEHSAVMHIAEKSIMDKLADIVTKNGGDILEIGFGMKDRKSTRLNSSHIQKSRMPSSA